MAYRKFFCRYAWNPKIVRHVLIRVAEAVCANAQAYEDYVRFYAHAPAGIEAQWQHLQQHVEVLAARLETVSGTEAFTALPRQLGSPLRAPEVELG
jgi:hypothetical protein